MNTNKSDNESHLLIQNQYFISENSLIQYIEWYALARISFVNCSFQNCRFNHFNARKGKFSNCHFEGCKITNSDMTRVEFYDTHFKNFELLSVDLA